LVTPIAAAAAANGKLSNGAEKVSPAAAKASENGAAADQTRN
jgi:hypothetical protein